MSGFEIECISGGPFGTNAYLISDPATRMCAVVDPGYEADRVWGQVIADKNFKLESVLLTHGHIDHTVGVAAMQRAWPGIPVLIHRLDAGLLTEGNVAVAQMYGLPPFEPAEPTGWLEEGVDVHVGDSAFKVLYVPGHCPGHVAFLNGKHLIGGDVLFADSIGRTDLPGGDFATLADSIVNKLMTLDDDVTVYPGHGPITTIGRERRTNSFVIEMISN